MAGLASGAIPANAQAFYQRERQHRGSVCRDYKRENNPHARALERLHANAISPQAKLWRVAAFQALETAQRARLRQLTGVELTRAGQ